MVDISLVDQAKF